MGNETDKVDYRKIDGIVKRLKSVKDTVIDGREHLAELIELFDINEDPKELEQLSLEWTVGEYIMRKVEANIPDVLSIYEKLKKKCRTQENPYVYNDMDNSLFYIPHKKRKVFAMTSQNFNFLVIYDGYEKENYKDIRLHIRRYWDKFKIRNKVDREESEDYKKKGMKHAIVNADWITERYSDNVANNQYVERPDLQWFKHKNFDLEYKDKLHMTKYNSYGDCRDPGYVLTCKSITFGQKTIYIEDLKEAIHYFSLIKNAIFDIRGAYEEMKSLK